ncbi:MAG: RNA polymerase sigma factor [Verrucomicrobiales bacterium]|nr:RNA polymerase sigma factor [Verrucomicrobiota bacterium JB025]
MKPCPPPAAQSDDASLIAAFIGGNERAFATYYARHREAVANAAMQSLNGDHFASEDITQDLFARIAADPATLRACRDHRAWLSRCARNLAANHIRAESRRSTREQLSQSIHPPLQPEVNFNRFEAGDLLSGLRDEDARLLNARFIEGRNIPEVANRIGVTPECAGKRITRVLHRLRRRLAAAGYAAATIIGCGTLPVPNTAATLPEALQPHAFHRLAWK